MKNLKFLIGILAVAALLLAIFFALKSENSLVTHPKGIIAKREWELIATNYLLMFIIIIPTFILLFLAAWKYHAKNKKAKHEPDKTIGVFGEVMLWVIPSIVIAVMVVITWRAAHELDPYEPIASDVKTLKIQVVALDWKWLFIYPEQGIAAINFIQFPAGTPIHFELAADNSPMNSFWIPQLSGQIYAMTGMTTQLHLMADEPGVFAGRAAEINGAGFAGMTFEVKSTSLVDFEDWVRAVKQSPLQLNAEAYEELTEPSQKHPVSLYSFVENDLFHKIVMKYMCHHCL